MPRAHSAKTVCTSMYYSKFTGNAQRRIRLKRAVRRTIIVHTYRENLSFHVYVGLAQARPNNIWKISDVSSMWGFAALAPIIKISVSAKLAGGCK